MKLHKIELSGYCAKSPEGPALYLGTAGSYGNEQLAVTLGKGWEGLTVTATFQPAGVTILVPADGTLDVPWEATEIALDAANGRIVFEGVTDGRVLISTDIPYAVDRHSGTEGSNTQPPTPSEWEQFVDEVKGDANRAEQAAKNAEATLQDVKDAGAQAVTDIGAAKDSALDAIAKAGEEAAGSIAADIQAAKDAAAAAAQSAKDAAAELPKVQQAGQTALDDIATERENSLTALEDEGNKQQSAVAGAGASALEAIGQTEQAAINQIQQAGATQAAAVQSAGTTQIGQINNAGAAQVQAVKDEGAAQTAALNDAAEAHKNVLEGIASHPPQPNTATGKWQVWNAETGAYQDTDALYQGGYYTPTVSDDGVLTWQGSQAGMPSLPSANVKGPQGPKGDPGLGVPSPTQSDAGKVPTVKADGSAYELAGPYAPLSAAIIETAKGNPAVCEDSVEWPLQGMRVYGKSTQVSTTGAQKISFPLWNEVVTRNGVTLTPTDSGFTVSGTASEVADFVSDNSFSLEENDYIMSSTGVRSNRVDRMCVYAKTGLPFCDIRDSNNVSVVSHIQEGNYYILYRVLAGQTVNKEYSQIMLNAGSTPLPYEPYTGGKPSPSPEYPQEIHSAGDEGEISITLSDGSNQSQSLTISTPNGLPGIPVNSGGNFVDADGQEWICNYRDWVRGVDVQNIANISYDSPDKEYVNLYWNSHREEQLAYGCVCFSAFSNKGFTIGATTILKCTHFTTNSDVSSGIPGNEGCMAAENRLYFRILLSTIGASAEDDDPTLLQAISDWLDVQLANGTLLSAIVKISSPIETPIPSDELAAYRALHTYDGSTVITPYDTLAEVEVDYIVKPKAYIEKKLTAIEQKIQEIAAAQLNAQTGG